MTVPTPHSGLEGSRTRSPNDHDALDVVTPPLTGDSLDKSHLSSIADGTAGHRTMIPRHVGLLSLTAECMGIKRRTENASPLQIALHAFSVLA